LYVYLMCVLILSIDI